MFCFYSLILSFFSLLLYCFFRGGIYSNFRLSGMSKSYISKMRRGAKNYWLYSAIHKERPMGFLYFLNAAFLSLFLLHFFAGLLGFLAFMRLPAFILSLLLCTVELPATVLASRYDTLETFGTPFVLLAKRKNGSKGYHSSLFFVLSWVIPAGLVFLSASEVFVK